MLNQEEVNSIVRRIDNKRCALQSELVEAYKIAQKYLEMLINTTPTGKNRNKLCDENINLLDLLEKLREL